MNFKKIISVLLGSFVLISVGIVAYNESKNIKASSSVKLTSNSNIEKKVSVNKWIDATYFYTTQRCYSCKLIEKYIKETLDKNFRKEITSEQINFQTINLDLPENKHYIQDYKLYTKSFILSLKKNGNEKTWLNCDKIWNLARNEQDFKKYIKSEVNKYLEIL